MAKAGAKKKAANGYKLAEILPRGEILEDVRKKKWRLGVAIGQGGFGRIYSAQDASSNSSSYPYVIKIEPHSNGPLYVEMQFYIRHCKPEDVNAFKKEKKLKNFGMPLYLGSGSHDYKGEKHRFVVTEHFGTDLWKIFLENNETFPATTVFKIATQILDVLEYIHGRGYVHADIKGANILMGTTKETKNKQVYLIDFGLATRYNTENEFKPDLKKAHDGTIEYLSRDAHKGVQTRRGDLEILAYNLIQWLGCNLPWMHLLKNPKDVQESKEKNMKEIPKFIQLCFGKRSPSGPIVDYLNYITSLEFNTEPDYSYIRKIFLSGIASGDSLDKPFQFTSSKKTPVKRKNDTKAAQSPKRKTSKTKPVKESEDEKENDIDTIDDKNDHDSFVDETPKRSRVRSRINYKEDSDDELKKNKRKVVKKSKSPVSEDLHVTGDNLEGYTDAMKEIVMKKKKKANKKEKGAKDSKVNSDTKDSEDDMDGYNDEMKELASKKKTSRKKTVKSVSSSSSRRNKTEAASEDLMNGDISDSY